VKKSDFYWKLAVGLVILFVVITGWVKVNDLLTKGDLPTAIWDAAVVSLICVMVVDSTYFKK
jgi:hypothetical protein